MITSAYCKNSNSSGFNPILQKFYEMICEIIFFKTVSGMFVIFCRSSSIVKSNFRNLKKLKYLEAHLFFKKYSTHRFEDHICTNKLENFFQGLAAFFATAKPLIWLSFSFHKKLILYIFFVWKIDDFTFLILHLLILEPYKLLKEEIKSSIFIILKGLSIKKITQIVLEGQSPTFSFMTEVRNFY